MVDCAAAGAAQRPRNNRARVVKPRRRRVICGLNLEGESGRGTLAQQRCCASDDRILALGSAGLERCYRTRRSDTEHDEARLVAIEAGGHGGITELAAVVVAPAHHGATE